MLDRTQRPPGVGRHPLSQHQRSDICLADAAASPHSFRASTSRAHTRSSDTRPSFRVWSRHSVPSTLAHVLAQDRMFRGGGVRIVCLHDGEAQQVQAALLCRVLGVGVVGCWSDSAGPVKRACPGPVHADRCRAESCASQGVDRTWRCFGQHDVVATRFPIDSGRSRRHRGPALGVLRMPGPDDASGARLGAKGATIAVPGLGKPVAAPRRGHARGRNRCRAISRSSTVSCSD